MMGINATFQFLAYGVPAIIALGGILLLALGYPTGNGSMIVGGWGLVFIGALIYVLELVLTYKSN